MKSIINNIASIFETHNHPGIVIGLSGTDSILSIIMVYQALKQNGHKGKMTAIHFGKDWSDDKSKLLKFSPDHLWMPRIVKPWLQTQCPELDIKIVEDNHPMTDAQRWAYLVDFSLHGSDLTEVLNKQIWIGGTRNRTEDVMGFYSNISNCVSIQPIVNLWKSEVLSMCEHYNVPDVAIRSSRIADCDCGRYDLASKYITELDMLLKHELDANYDISSIDFELRNKLTQFIVEQKGYYGYKKHIPYIPGRG